MLNDKDKYEAKVNDFLSPIQIKQYVKKYGRIDAINSDPKEEVKQEDDEEKSEAGSDLSETSGIENHDDSDESMEDEEKIDNDNDASS